MKDCIDIKIYYEDTDCGGVVYYGKYLTYLEHARTEFLEARGVSLIELMKDSINFVVVHVDIRYHKPARYGDVISIRSAISEVTPVTVTFLHEIIRRDSDEPIASASVKLAFVGKKMKPQRMKRNIVDALRRG